MTNAEELNALFRVCLLSPDEVVNGEPSVPTSKPVTGITMSCAFHAGRLAMSKAQIAALTHRVLSDAFYNDTGGGASFLLLCTDQFGGLWADHRTCEQLVVLGLSLGYVKYCLPEMVWHALPGAVPYLVVDRALLQEARA